MATQNAEGFRESYESFAQYPTNLLARSLVKSYSPSLVQSLQKRLSEQEDKLFYEDDKESNLGILDIGVGASFTGRTPIIRLRNDDDTRTYLGDNAQQATLGADFPFKVDPRCRFIFLPCRTQADPLKLTANMLRRILSYHQVMPQFLEFLFGFGFKTRIPDVRFDAFHSDVVVQDPAAAQCLSSIGRSGYQYQVCCNMRSANYDEKEERWSIRQIAVYHRFDIRMANQLWIFGHPHEAVPKVITDRYQLSPDDQQKRLGSIADSFRTSLEIHLSYIQDVAVNWRTRIDHLEEDLWQQTLQIRGEPGRVNVGLFAGLQDAQKTTRDVLAVLQSNQTKMKSLSDFYENRSNITNNEKLSTEEVESCKESITNFAASIKELIRENEMETRQTKLLLQDFEDLNNIFIQRRNDDLATKMEIEAVAMRIITVITLIYLPPTAISTFFSAGVLETNSSSGGDSPSQLDATTISVSIITSVRDLWLKSALPLTIGTGIIAMIWFQYEMKLIEFECSDPQVTVLNGTYAGVHLPEFNQDLFLGMPYAQNTSGENRFRIPQSLTETWQGARSAKEYGDACPDENIETDGVYGMSENCLSINVVRPAGVNSTEKIPVMLWIHGGSYQVGTSAIPNYNLTYIVERSVAIGKPILGVSINYRKGAWGMLYSIEIQGSGNANLSLRDMRKSLEWIQENIAFFGGDPSRVTIWGESAGSFAVGQLLLSYGGRSDGLFHRSIQESGSATTAWYNGSDWYQPLYNQIVNQVNCSDTPDTLSCLRGIDYDVLYPIMGSSQFAGPGFYPTVDGDIIPNYPSTLMEMGQIADVPHLYGTNSDEGTDNAPVGTMNTDEDIRNFLLYEIGFDFPESVVDKIMELYPNDPAQGIPLNTGNETFAEEGLQYKRIAAILGDVFYHATRRHDAQRYAALAPTYTYRFNTRGFVNSTNATFTDYSGELQPAYKGVSHFTEVAFVFSNPQYVGPWPEYQALSRQMSAQWINFVYCGDPNGDNLPAWPKYNESDNGLNLVLQTESQGGSYAENDTYRLAGRDYLTMWARRRHV